MVDEPGLIDFEHYGEGSYGVPNPAAGWRQLNVSERLRAEAPRAMVVERLMAQHEKNLLEDKPRAEDCLHGIWLHGNVGVDEIFAIVATRAEFIDKDSEGLRSDYFVNGKGAVCEFARSERISFEKQCEIMEIAGELVASYPDKGLWVVVPAEAVGDAMIQPTGLELKDEERIKFTEGVMGCSTPGSKMMIVMPRVTREEALVSHGESIAKGWLMPAGASMGPLRYTMLHEWGHLMDRPPGDRRNHKTEWMVGGERDSSGYGVSSIHFGFHSDRNAESFAEAFAEWHGSGGLTKNPRVRGVAELEGWVVPPLGVELPAGREI